MWFTYIKRYILDQHRPKYSLYHGILPNWDMAPISPTYNNIEQNNDEKKIYIKHVTINFLAKYVRV